MTPTPKALQKKKLTVAEAVDQFAETTNAISVLADLREQAKEFLIAHGQKTGKRTFLGRVAMVRTGGSLNLDQKKAVELLTERGVEIPRKPSKLGWSLKLLD